MTTPTPFLHRLYLGGCLLLVTTPLLLYLWLAIQGVPYLRCIVTPGEVTWRFNPFFNLWPVTFISGVIIGLVFTLTNGSSGRGVLKVSKTGLQGFVGGSMLALMVLSSMTSVGAWLNARFDGSVPVQHQVQVIDKVVESEKFGNAHYLVVTDWRVPAEGTVRVCAGDDYQAGRALSQNAAITSLVNVSTRRGLLGLEWVVAVEQAQAEAEP